MPKPIFKKTRELCVYLIETEKNRVNPVSEDVITFVRNCLQDKIFSHKDDTVLTIRDDRITYCSTFNMVSWDVLKKFEEMIRSDRYADEDLDPIKCIEDTMGYMKVQDKRDVYDYKKIIFFALLDSKPLDANTVKNMMKDLKTNGIILSIVLPDEKNSNEIQKRNFQLLSPLVEATDHVSLSTHLDAKIQLTNIATKKATRATAWSCPLIISPQLKIDVGGYVCTRINKPSAIKKVLLDENRSFLPSENSSSTQLGGSGARRKNNSGGDASADDENEDNQIALQDGETTADVPKYSDFKNSVEKEVTWVDKEGNQVDEDNISKSFYYGDKLIPDGAFEGLEKYSSGPKCLNLLLFTQKENIKPFHLTGDGTTLFWPKDDPVSEKYFSALVKSLNRLNRVAIVRKVYNNEKSVQVGCLSPDLTRKCLVYNELCFADDISIPSFEPLVRGLQLERDNNDEDNPKPLSKKEELVDYFIKRFQIEDFSPFQGPVDPFVVSIRKEIAHKVVPSLKKDQSIEDMDSLKLFFESTVVGNPTNELQEGEDVKPLLAIEDLHNSIRTNFELNEKPDVKIERPSGANIFRKRAHGENNEVGEDSSVDADGGIDEKRAKNEEQEQEEVGNSESAAVMINDDDNMFDDL